MVERAIRRLEEMRSRAGRICTAATSSIPPRMPANKVRGSIGRTQSGNFALWRGLAQDRRERSRTDFDEFLAEHTVHRDGPEARWPHESWYQTAPYYYYFGHYYAARLIEKLGDEGKSKYGEQLRNRFCRSRSPMGRGGDYAMWDYTSPTAPPSPS
jgi:hypothetical protein